mgnify:CR=1 FL=1
MDLSRIHDRSGCHCDPRLMRRAQPGHAERRPGNSGEYAAGSRTSRLTSYRRGGFDQAVAGQLVQQVDGIASDVVDRRLGELAA